MEAKNCLVVLGPTASGKTTLAVRLATELSGEILSVDSRQVYRGLDIGAGKDLSEYFDERGKRIPYHLIDVVDLDCEYSVFEFQRDFFRVFEATLTRGNLPMAVGGTGLYLEAILEKYEMIPVDRNRRLRAELETLSTGELSERLKKSKPNIHNTTDLTSRDRIVRAIEIAEASGTPMSEVAPEIRPFIIGIQWERSELRQRIGVRLRERMDQGMIAEVEDLHHHGVSWERMEQLGLEYRYVSEFLQGRIKNKNDLTQKLHTAINQFAKRQMTWFRRMERKGTEIHWIPEGNLDRALQLIEPIEWTANLKNTS